MNPAGGSVLSSDHSPKNSSYTSPLILLSMKGLIRAAGLLSLLLVMIQGSLYGRAQSFSTPAAQNPPASGAQAPPQHFLYLPSVSMTTPPIQAPVLKWKHAGCYSSWCETGWYSSPAVADLEGDGNIEVIGSTYTIFVFDGSTGNLEWRVKSGHDRSENPDSVSNVGRTWAGIVITDLDNDSQLEIVTARHEGYVSVPSTTTPHPFEQMRSMAP